MDPRTTSRASSRQPVEQLRNSTIANSNTSRNTSNTTSNNNNNNNLPATTTTTTRIAATPTTTTRRTRSRSNTPAPVPALPTSTLAALGLSTISEGAAQPDEAGPSTTNNPSTNTANTNTNATTTAVRKSRARPANRGNVANPLDAPPFFSTRANPTTTNTNTDSTNINSTDRIDINTTTVAAAGAHPTGLLQTTGPALSLFSQPPPAFSQPFSPTNPFNTSFGATPLNTFGGGGPSNTFGGAPLNALFGSAPFTAAREARGTGGMGGATAANRSSSSFISTLSSPTASGNFRDTSAVLPNITTPTTMLPTRTSAPLNTTALTAPRDSRAHVISDDEEPDDDEFSRQLRDTTSRTTGTGTGPRLHRDTANYLLHNPTSSTHLVGDEEDEEAGADSHFNDIYGSSRPRRRTGPRSFATSAATAAAATGAADRPAPTPFDKELVFYREMHAGGEPGNTRGAGAGGGKGGVAGTSTSAGAGTGAGAVMAAGAGAAGTGTGTGAGAAGTGVARRGTAIPSRGRGGRSQKLTRSGPTVASLMGAGGVETSVSYGAAAASAGESSRGVGRAGAGDGPGEPIGAAIVVAAAAAGGHVGAPADTSRGRDRDTGGIGPHRNSRRRASPVGMSSHPYAFSGLTPSSNFTSSGNTDANVDGNINPASAAAAAAMINNPTMNALGLGLANTNARLDGNAEASAGPATQIWHAAFGVLGGDIDDDNDDDDVPSRANQTPGRSRSHHRAGLHHHTPSNNGAGAAAEEDPIVDEPTDDEGKSKEMADERRRGKWQREAEARKLERRNAKGKGTATPKKLGRPSSDDDNDRTPTQASQQGPAFSVAPAPVASTSQGASGVGGVVPKKSGRPGLWKLAAGTGVEESGTNPENRPAHSRSETVASGSNLTIISRLDSAVSQLPALPGIPGSYEGLSGIGGQNELGVSQFEESLPALRYNSRRTGPALSTVHDEEDDNARVGISFNPYVDLESQTPSRPHSDIVYNSSGNPVARSSGQALRSESSEILEPLRQPLPDEIYIPAAQQPLASGSKTSQSTSQSTSSSQGRKKIRFGSYDPADDLVSWDNPADPNRDPGETTGPQLFTPEQEELQRRVKNILRGDDHAGNLEYGRSRQTILDSVVRPFSEIRAASTSASPTRAAPRAPVPIPATTTTGPTIGDDPANPLVIDDDPPSPTMSEIRRAGRHYVRTIVIPDRDRRLRGVHSDDEEMQGVGAPAPLPTFQLPQEGSELDEEEVVVEDDAQPEAEAEPRPNGTVLVPNSSGSAVADDNDAEDLDPDNAEEKPIMGEWHEDQLDEVSLEDKMEGLFPSHSFISEPPLDTTPLGQALARQTISTQPSISSIGDIPDNPLVDYSALYPPNQEAYMKMHAVDVSDAETEPSVYPSQPIRPFHTNFTPFSDGDLLGEAADNNPPSGKLTSYPHPDNLSISTDNSVLRSQLYSSKLMAYNAEQAGLKPGDEGYTEPPEENYVKWARAEGFSDAASTETAPSVAPAKVKPPFANPFLGLRFRMPGASETQLSEDETSRPSGDSFAVIPDSQGEPPLLSQPPPKASKMSTKTTDPRRRPPPVTDNNTHAYSEAGPGRTRASPQSTKNRTAWQATSARPYVGSPMRSVTPPELFLGGAGRSATPAPLVDSLPGTSQVRSEAEAQIEAELIPETQFSQQISHASSPSLGTYSPVIRYDHYLERLSEEPRNSSRHKPIILVPGTASPSQASNIISREPSALASQLPLEVEGDTDEEGLIVLSGAPQEDSFGLSDIGGQNEWVPETQHEHFETQNEPTDTSVPAPTIPSFELPDPASTTAEAQQLITGKRKRKRDEDPAEPVEDPAGKPSPSKKARKVPVPPAPLPVEPAEPIRRTRSFSRLSSNAPTSHGPLVTPVPPARLTDAGRSRKPIVVPRTPPPRPQRKTVLSSIIESSSPLSPPPPSARKETASPIRRSKTYLKGRTLVPDSSASQVDDGEALGISGEQAETQTSGTQATQDPFKALAKSVSKSKLGKRKASLASADPFSTTKSIVPANPSTRKRTREEAPEDNVPSVRTDLSPPPSKKHRRGASVSKPKKPLVKATTSKQPKPGALFVSSPHRACQRGGRVFARWGKFYYTATVKDSWEDPADGDEIRCQVQFDDKTWAEILLSELYQCELQEGDKIMVPGPKGKTPTREGYVSAVPLWEDRYRVSVRLASIPVEEVAIFDGKRIAVDAKYVQKEWKERKATCLEDFGLGEELVRVQQERERKEAEAKAIGRTIPSAAFLGPPRWKDSPPPPPRLSSLPSRGRFHPPQATDVRPRLEAPPTTESSKPFAGHLIILALAVNDDKGNPLEKSQRTAQKQDLTANIERLGGKVVDGFEELLQWGGKVDDDADRWVWKAGAMKYVEEEPSAPTGTSKRGRRTPGPTTSEPPKIFLVADGPNRATKYLMALAAGIPCIDQGWIRDENAAPWHTYLLPAGQSPSLGHTCSQWVRHSYSDHPRTLKNLLDEPGPVHKTFDDKTILLLYPSRSGSEIEEDQVAHTYAYAALACLMGASRVEVVHDLNAASHDMDQYDAIVHEDESLPAQLLRFSKSKKGKNVICTDINWVRDCLITGTFLRHSKLQ